MATCRYKVLPDGQRQIMAFFVPGDFCDLNVFILDQMDHSIGTISACQVAEISRHAIEEITVHHPRVTRALMWCALVDEAVLREWLVNIGGRQADKRIAHLFCELLLRLEAVGRVTNNSYAFPFTQSDVADTMGLSGRASQPHAAGTSRAQPDHAEAPVLTILDVEQLRRTVASIPITSTSGTRVGVAAGRCRG